MLASNNWSSVTCQSCCCQTCQVDHLKKAVEPADSVSYKCLCKLTTCSHDASHLSQAVTSHEDYLCPQSQDVVKLMYTGDLPCTSVSSGIRHVQCTCRAESQLTFRSASVAHCIACICRHRSKPENLIRVVRCDELANNAAADCKQYCCTCIGNFSQVRGMSSCHNSVALSYVNSSVCPVCTKLTGVNRQEQSDTRLTLRYSDLCSVEQETVSCRCGQSGGVVMEVNEWQRRHIEELDRQKLEV